MENKYYTPKIEEFNQGFRYEHYIPSKEIWAKETFFLNDSHVNIVKYVDIQTEDTLLKIRVKALDHDDIKEAGWEESYKENNEIYVCYKIKHFVLTKFNTCDDIVIEDDEPFDETTTYFNGRIPNYNKLLEVMDMIGVEREEK